MVDMRIEPIAQYEKYHRLASVLYVRRYGSYELCMATALCIYGRLTLEELNLVELENLAEYRKAKLVN
jgi:hypothetical protein